MGRIQAVRALACALLLATAVLAQSESTYDALAASQLEHARNEFAKVKSLVAEGTLPRSKAEEAQEQVADAEDNLTLAHTLYRQIRVEEMTPADAAAMTDAARRRVERAQKVVDSRKGFVESGILARSDMEACEQELSDRQHVLTLAQNRAGLLSELQKMAEAERQLEDARSNAMIRYDGSGVFQLSEMAVISSQFQRRFNRPLPVSAVGQTLVHQAMGLDHRGRVDVALRPDSPEGLWLRQVLERLRIPYLAFRSAVLGAATAPHIHIGPGSQRLPLTAVKLSGE